MLCGSESHSFAFLSFRGENAEEEDWCQEEGGEPARAGETAQSIEKHRRLSQAPLQRFHGKRPLKEQQVAGRQH